MTKSTYVNLDKFLVEFGQLEHEIAEVTDKNSLLEMTVEDANRHIKFNQSKQKSLTEERDSLLGTVNGLQQALQDQCNLRVENERLKSDLVAQREDNERTVEVREAEVQQLLSKLKAEEERHQRALEALKQQYRREVEEACREAFSQREASLSDDDEEAKDAEVTALLERKEADVEELRRRLRDQEREKQSELLKLQMEFGVKLARVQSSSQWNQQQQQQQQQQQLQGSHLIPQSVFKRKLQFIQEEKNKEIAALRQRIKELEENQLISCFNNNNNKRRKN